MTDMSQTYGSQGHQARQKAKSLTEQAQDIGQQAYDQTVHAGTVARDTAKEYPLATLAVIGGVAFALGALWKLGRPSPRRPYDQLVDGLAHLQNRLPRNWRA